MAQQQTIKRSKPKTKDNGPIMLLSLFLLLLAFFILLNALSTFEEAKARKVIQSVTSVFKTELINKTKAQIFISLVGPVPETKKTLDQLEKMWVTAVPLSNTVSLQDGSTMQVSMPVNELFVPGDAGIRTDRTNILGRTAEALSRDLEGGVLELQFMMGVDSIYRVSSTITPSKQISAQEQRINENPEEINLGAPEENSHGLAFSRVGVVARMLEELKVPKARITIGLQEEDPKQVVMRFLVHPEEGAYTDLKGKLPDPDGQENAAGNEPAENPAPNTQLSTETAG